MSQRKVWEAGTPQPQGGPSLNETERDAVRSQMDRILAHPLFKNSRRYPMLFRYVVEQSLQGHADLLRERRLGMEVFGRGPDYDTNLDPVVRVTAGEIRKRIAQYYYDPQHAGELRIDLPCGSYVPEFDLTRLPSRRSPFSRITNLVSSPWRRLRVATGICLIAGASLLAFRHTTESAVERFWGPVWETGPVLLCIGSPETVDGGRTNAGPIRQGELKAGRFREEYVSLPDAIASSSFAGLFHTEKKPYSMRISSPTSPLNLRSGPAVLVGGFSNPLTMRLLSQLRYRFGRDAATQVEWIEDRQDPSRSTWKVDTGAPMRDRTEDYALITRILNPATVVVAAGLTPHSTVAAGEFLTNPGYLEELASRAPRRWRRQNLQAVIAANVIGGQTGRPRIVATYFW